MPTDTQACEVRHTSLKILNSFFVSKLKSRKGIHRAFVDFPSENPVEQKHFWTVIHAIVHIRHENSDRKTRGCGIVSRTLTNNPFVLVLDRNPDLFLHIFANVLCIQGSHMLQGPRSTFPSTIAIAVTHTTQLSLYLSHFYVDIIVIHMSCNTYTYCVEVGIYISELHSLSACETHNMDSFANKAINMLQVFFTFHQLAMFIHVCPEIFRGTAIDESATL